MTRSSGRRIRSASSGNADDVVENASGRRSTRSRKQATFFTDTTTSQRKGSGEDDDDNVSVASEGADNASDEDIEEEAPAVVRRKSSRSTAFRGGMKDPSNSIADLLKPIETMAKKKPRTSRGARQQASKRSSLEGSDGSEDDEGSDEDDMYASPVKKRPSSRRKGSAKSPAKRHSRRRMSKRLEVPQYDESSEEEEEGSEESDEGESGDEEENENEDMKINKIIACRSMKLKEWKGVCQKMNTTEITNGSRWVQEEDDDADLEKYEERFLVKWDNLSFLHCSWETERDMVEFCEGAKGRLSTFFRKAEGGLLYEPDERLDGDYFDPSWITIERILEVPEEDDPNDDEPTAEIILDVKDPNFEDGTGRQFYVKWVNKSYSESTFEFERDLILNEVEYEDQLASYNARKAKPTRTEMKRRDQRSDKQERELYKIFGDKIKQSDEEREGAVKEYQNALEKRAFGKVGGQLRDYQAEGVSWLMSNHLNKRSSILADEMGLGKTVQTATYVYTVSQQLVTRGPFLIVAPLSTIPHWYREFTGWTDLNTIVYHGSYNDRERAREDEFVFPSDRVENVAFNQRYLQKVAKKWRAKWERTWMVEVVITTPEMLVTEDFAELAAVKWEILVVDEAHRLKNHNSKLAQNLRDDRFAFKHSLLLTGTPIQNNMQELWTLLNFINPDTFDNLDAFMEHYGDIKSKEKVDELHETIRPYILRRLKEDVEKSVPPKEETLIEVELTVLQKQYYRALYEKNLKFLHRNKKKPMDGPSINNLAMQLRKCCNHPFLLTGVEAEVRAQDPNADALDSLVKASGKFVLLDKLLPRLKTDGHRILLFSQFKIMLDIIEDYLHLRNFKVERIDGSITGAKRQAAIDRFQAKDTSSGREQPFIMLLSTRAGGVGINLTAADTCIIFDSDWNPQNDLQAQARCHRIGQTKNVKIYRLLTRKTYEMQMFHMSSMKMGLDQAVLQGIENSSEKDIMTKEEVEKLLKHGAYDIFKEDQEGNSEKESNDFVSQDIDSILERRAKTVVHENTGSNSNAAGGTFSKASFKNTNTDGIAAAEVDVDDPDFWTKVVGEAKEEEAEQLGKRQRTKGSYSEKEYLKKLDAAIRDGAVASDGNDDVSLSSYSDTGENSEDDDLELDNEALKTIVEASKATKQKEERFLWGGAAPTEWKLSDAEQIMKALTSFGYRNISWPRFNCLLKLSKSMKLDEIKRMSWALSLLCILEAAEDKALEAARKIEAASKQKSSEGGVLGRTGEGGATEGNDEPAKSDEKPEGKKDQLEESFKQLLTANEGWVKKALEDAMAFPKTIGGGSRDKEYVQSIIDGHRPSKNKSKEEDLVQSKLTADFLGQVWPALRSRGWKDDDKKKGFTFKGKTFKSIPAVLDAIPKHHPELVNHVNSVISSVAASCQKPTTDSFAPLDLNNMSAKSLKLFLMDFAPLQLLADRKRAHRIGLSKRLLSHLALNNGLHQIVSTADLNALPEATVEERNVQLSKLINIKSKSALPHPEWTSLHDAILTRAVTKHGWIHTQENCLAIGHDSTIRWGAPFEVSGQGDKEDKEKAAAPAEEEKCQTEYTDLFNTASRALNFLQKLNLNSVEGIPPAVLNDMRERLITSFGLAHDESDETWKVAETKLKKILRPTSKEADACEALPTRKKLIKRLRKIVTSFDGKEGTAPEEEKEDSPQDTSQSTTNKVEFKGHCIHLIDQNDRHNILLAEMIRGQLMMKQATKVNMVKYYTTLIFDEIDARVRDLARTDGNESPTQALKKTRKDIQLYFNNRQRMSRAAKNILRVMIGINPVQPKVAGEPLFAVEDVKPSTPSMTAKAALTKLKKKKAFTPADSALSRALTSYLEDKDGIKDCLLLTSTEILALTVLSSQGLPVFDDDWTSLVNAPMTDDELDEEFIIYFWAMAGVMQSAAEVWLEIAKKKLRTELYLHTDTQSISEKDQSKIATLKKDQDAKEMTLKEAKSYSNDPLLFARKCIMLVEAIRKNMGPVDLQYAGEKKIRQLNKSENGLGTKVLNWLSKDLQKWAGSLGAVDKAGKVISSTSITPAKDHPQSHDAAMMTKRDCRTVFIQIAQQTRLRSIFIKNKAARLSSELIPKALKQSSFAMTDWDDCPAWWNELKEDGNTCDCCDDLDLLVGILDYGYGGFDSMLQHDYSFCKRLTAKDCEDSNALTRATAQVRINHLTRELHAINETEEMMKLVEKTKRKGESEKPCNGKVKKAKNASIQSGLQAFFKHKKKGESSPGSRKRKTPPTSPENSDVEVIEIDSDSSDKGDKKYKQKA
eukprot:CAMPEP_0172532664 /NCGR_PEP_ID=MMETSP1067-20121228/5630_1 /TAXON_ID=265564 ORGANISM="Thalassiosira punctigera, Strain Tpunct2005C2" /NCGR_SAMPLE_ID=MMETSP1067 /ASSEMBLY_ACC=CAM_ASM_000444 /LENGTH=2277 /DNA_ID=CAMNT_0013317209 /DNA_START=169 /DNA_END=7002 /DNA_ORIENTATION=+